MSEIFTVKAKSEFRVIVICPIPKNDNSEFFPIRDLHFESKIKSFRYRPFGVGINEKPKLSKAAFFFSECVFF